MLIAEVGLPPGVDVDRASLESLFDRDRALSRYDILPDRVLLYLWPRGNPTSLEIAFRPRLAQTAQSAPSQLYDYYNPEAALVLAPERFVIDP